LQAAIILSADLARTTLELPADALPDTTRVECGDSGRDVASSSVGAV